MQYSLLSRFQGTLLGAALGEILGTAAAARLQARLPLSNLEDGRWAIAPLLAGTPSGWGKIAVSYAQQLSQATRQIEGSPPIAQATQQLDRSGMAIAALPIALFFHEDRNKLRLKLGQFIADGDIADRTASAEMQGAVWAVGEAIALALQAQLRPADLLPYLLSELDLTTCSPVFAQQLTTLQTCLQQNLGFTATMSLLCNLLQPTPDLIPFALAFYYFLSTPEAYDLTVLRSVLPLRLMPALQCHYQSGVTTALAGALSGAYNGLNGIPLNWRQWLSRPALDPPLVGLWGLESEDKIKQLAGELLATWSGIFQPSLIVTSPSKLPVTAAPEVIRPR